MVHILEGFKPDEYARDPIDPAVIAVLQDEQAVAPSTRPPLSDLTYRPMIDDASLLKVGGEQASDACRCQCTHKSVLPRFPTFLPVEPCPRLHITPLNLAPQTLLPHR